MCQSAVFSPLVSGESFTLPRSAERNSLAQVQRKTSRPLGANPPARFKCPGQPVQRKDGRLSGLMTDFE